MLKNCSDNRMLKLGKLALCCLLVASLLFGCSPATPAGTETSEPAGSGPAVSELPDGLRIVSGGASDYTIYYERSLGKNDELLGLINSVPAQIRAVTGAVLPMSSDQVWSQEKDAAPAILIGATRFSESAAMAEDMKTEDYFVGISGNKLLLLGATPESCSAAIRYFLNQILPAAKETQTLAFRPEQNFRKNGKYLLDSVRCLGEELSRYRMVLPASPSMEERMFAGNLHAWLAASYGRALNVVSEAEPPAERELLIGSARGATPLETANSYQISAEGGKLAFRANGMIGYEMLYYYAAEQLFKPDENGNCAILSGTEPTNAVPLFEERFSAPLENNADLRTLFYNVYGHTDYQPAQRVQMQLTLLKTYLPDILCFQEFTYHSRTNGFLEGLQALGYEEVPARSSGANCTPIFYRTDVLEPAEGEETCGFLLYDGPNDASSKSITWAVLRVKATGKRVIALSTHFYWTQDATGREARKNNAQQLTDEIARIRAIGDYATLPLIVGGDLNCTAAEAPVSALLGSGLVSAWDTALEKNSSKGHHSYAEYDGSFKTFTKWSYPSGAYSASIDHVFRRGEFTVNRFATLTSLYALFGSDHCPELLDITLPES